MPEHSDYEEDLSLLRYLIKVSRRSMRRRHTDRSRRTNNYSRRLRPIW